MSKSGHIKKKRKKTTNVNGVNSKTNDVIGIDLFEEDPYSNPEHQIDPYLQEEGCDNEDGVFTFANTKVYQ